MKTAEAAQLLGVPPEEITNVEDSDAGTIITTFDGQRYIDVPTDHPDADGQTGLMFLVAPSASYGGSYPVFAQLGAAGDEEIPVEEKEAIEQVPGLPGTSPDTAERNSVTAEEKKAALTGPARHAHEEAAERAEDAVGAGTHKDAPATTAKGRRGQAKA